MPGFARKFRRALFFSLLGAVSAFAAARRPVPSPASATPRQVESLARGLKGESAASAYSRLSALAVGKTVLAARAALALGYYDYSREHFPDAAKWLERARRDPLLGDYVLYWQAENEFAQQHNPAALALLQQLRKNFPNSVMTEQALEALGEAALAANQPDAAVAAINAYSLTPERPALLLLRGEALERAQQPVQAAADYLAIYTRYPLSDQGAEAASKLDFLRSTLGDQIPPLPVALRSAHADTIFNAGQWTAARSEYAALLPDLAGASRERAELRIMECGVQLGAGVSELSALQVSDTEVDAERLYNLADYYRAQQQDAQVDLQVEAVVARAPSSHWADDALFLAGNYYWVQLDRDRASAYYQRDQQQFPTSSHAAPAQWRVAWTAVLKRSPNAADLLAEHLRRFPGSTYTPDALYWLGRLAEEASDNDSARTYYARLGERYPGNFFDQAAAQRTPRSDPGPTPPLALLATIPPVPPAAPVAAAIPRAAAERQARADALRSIAFDASADLELRAAYDETGEPRLLVEAAQADVAAGNWGQAIVTLRQLYPQLEYRPAASVPREVWEAAYPLPHESSIRRWAAHNHLDPLLVAGLSRQESAFNPEARSVSNAFGVMQLLPETGRRFAKDQRVRYAQSKLLDSDYNIRLGTAYLAWLKAQFGSVEEILAAYNAGENRVTAWIATPPRDMPEFVDSIPFSQTREYVEIITRNVAIYHRLYDKPAKSPAKSSARPAARKPAAKKPR